MEPEWSVWIREHMPKALYEQYRRDTTYQREWRDKVIKDKERLLMEQNIKNGIIG